MMVRLAWGGYLGTFEGDGEAIVGLMAAATGTVARMLWKWWWVMARLLWG